MKSKTNQNTTKTTKTKPFAEDKALAELVRTKVLDFGHDMKKLCKEHNLSFDISGWVEDPVDRGDSPDKTLKFRCGNANPLPMLGHKFIDISVMFKFFVKNCSYDEVTRLFAMAEHLIGYACNKVMTNLNNKTKSKTKEN